MTSDEASYRYRGFISYSQKDGAKAKRLHRALEAYRVPKKIDATGLDEKKRTLGRFFRDNDEMGAATDLGAALQGAIADSQNLIVLCSPQAARSRWVNEEILHFKRTGRGASIFAVIMAGIPNSGDPDTECFPAALRFQMGEDGALTDKPAEPLGLDWRKDGFPRLKARLAAGILGVSFDDLWRRDRRRARGRAGVRGLLTLVVLAVVGAVALLVEDRFSAAEVRTVQNNLVRLGQLALSEGDNRQAIRYGIAALHYGSLDHHQDRVFLHEALTALEPEHVPHSAFVTMPGPLEFDFGTLPNGDPHVHFVRVFADDRYVVAVTRRGGNIFDRRLGHSIGIEGVIDRPQDIVEIEGGAMIVMVDRPPPDLLSERVIGDPLPEPPTRAPEYGLAIYDFPSNTRVVTAGGVKAHALSHDGLRIFLSLNTGQSCLFDVATSRELNCLEGAPDNAVRAAFSPDDRRLAIVDLSGTITVFDSDDLILTVPRSQAYPHDVEFVGGSDRLLVHDARAVRTEFRVPQCPVVGSVLYGVPGGNTVATLNRLCDPAAVSNDQRTLMTPSTFADVGSGEIRTATVFNGADYATSADGTMLAVSFESEIHVYDTQSAGLIGVFGGLAKAPKHLLFTDNDARIFGMDEFGFGVIWDITATSTPPTPLVRQYPGRQARILLASQDRAVDHDGRRLTVWGLADGEADLELGFWPFEISRIIVSPDERFLAVGLSSGEVAIIETANIGAEVTANGVGHSPKVKTRFKAGEEPVEAIRFSADNTTVFVSNGQPQTGYWAPPRALSLSAWNVATGERLGSLGRVTGPAAVSPDGGAFVVIEEDGIFRLRDTRTGSVRLTLPAMEGASGDQLSHRSRFSTDGRLLLTTFVGPTRDRLNWRVWNVADDQLGSEGSIVDVRFAEFSDDFSTLFALDARSRRHVFAVSADTGKSLWRTLLPGQEGSSASFKLRDGSLQVAHGIDLYTVDTGTGTIESRRTLPFRADSFRTKSFMIQLIDDFGNGDEIWSLEAFGGVSATREGALIGAICDFDQGELLAGYRVFPVSSDRRSGFANVPSSVAWDACEPHPKPRIVDRAFVVWDAVYDTIVGLADDAFEVVEGVL